MGNQGSPAHSKSVKLEFSGDALAIGDILARFPDGSLLNGDGKPTSTQGIAATNLAFVTSVAARIDIINDTDADGNIDAGERVMGGNYGANGGDRAHFGTDSPQYFKLGTTPKAKSDTSGVLTVTGTGFVYR